MNREEGIITRTEGETAWVKVRRSSMCEVCNNKVICNTLSDGNTMEAEVYNPLNGRIGDRVEFMISTSSLLKITSLLYIIPVVFLLAGSILGYGFFSPPEFYALIFGLSGFSLSYFVIRFISRIMVQKRKFTPEIIRIF